MNETDVHFKNRGAVQMHLISAPSLPLVSTVNCPSTHPYAYLNGDFCCAEYKDYDNKQISYSSTTCKSNQNLQCPIGPGQCKNYPGGLIIS